MYIMETDTDVLIVGAGPTGLMLALTLMRSPHDCRVRIVDKSPLPAQESRALVVQSRSLELLQQFQIPGPRRVPPRSAAVRSDITTRLRDKGLEGLGLATYVYGRLTLALDTVLGGFPGTQFPQPMLVSQAETEATMAEALAAAGVKVERDINVEELREFGDAVEATLVRTDGSATERIRARYVVGCDGAHSIVRHSAGLSFHGGAYAQDFILCDSRVDWGTYESAAINSGKLIISWGDKLLAVIPMAGDLVRLISIRDAAPPSSEAKKPAPPTVDEFQTILDVNIGPGMRIHDPRWLSSFRLHHRGVDRYRSGRMFVAGDAAHIHSPIGGQGMNTGVQDAANLGWKLATVVHAERKLLPRMGSSHLGGILRSKIEALLDSYHAERQPVGEALLSTTDRIFEFLASDTWLVRIVRPLFFRFAFPLIMSVPSWRTKATQFFTQLRVRYRRSPIIATGPGIPVDAPVRGGWRAPDGRVKRLDTYCKRGPDDDDDDDDEEWLLSSLGMNGVHWLAIFTRRSSPRSWRDAGPHHHYHHTDDTNMQRIMDKTRTVFKERGDDVLDVGFLRVDDGGGMVADPGPYQFTQYADPNGQLHQRWGFDAERGFALVRPDGYVAYIGLLSHAEEYLEWIKDYPAAMC